MPLLMLEINVLKNVTYRLKDRRTEREKDGRSRVDVMPCLLWKYWQRHTNYFLFISVPVRQHSIAYEFLHINYLYIALPKCIMMSRTNWNP